MNPKPYEPKASAKTPGCSYEDPITEEIHKGRQKGPTVSREMDWKVKRM